VQVFWLDNVSVYDQFLYQSGMTSDIFSMLGHISSNLQSGKKMLPRRLTAIMSAAADRSISHSPIIKPAQLGLQIAPHPRFAAADGAAAIAEALLT
jgi:hypothetical protein